jgi:predicted nucleotidyltransferase component of viral defense system
MWGDGKMISRSELRRTSVRVGLGLKFVSKDLYLSSMLKHLEGSLGPECVLKGGTVISRAKYLDTPRFSEDIDIDAYTDLTMKEVGTEYLTLFEGLDEFTIERPRIHKKLVRYDAYFENHFGEKDRIRVEIVPKRDESPDELFAPRTILQSQFTYGEASLLRAFKRDYLFSMKILALSGRRSGKDVFDLRGMWRSGIGLDESTLILSKLAELEGSDAKAVISLAMVNLDKMREDIRPVMNSTNHYIPRPERPDWRALLEEVRDVIKLFKA